ncbi:MAG: Uma2 family endonuclease [Anaerolineae bacterium]
MTLEVTTRITAETYYQLPEYEHYNLIQLIDGEVVIGMAAIPKHQTVVGNAHVMLWLSAKQHGGKAFTSPIEVYLDQYNVYEPDVVYLAQNSRCVVEEKRLTGAPDLVVEVLSPSTAKVDRDKKFNAYQAHGVREYWIADPANAYLEVWVLRDALFVKSGTFVAGDTFECAVLNGQVIQVGAIFEG